MRCEQIVERYLECLVEADLHGMGVLFSDGAVVRSPLYGERPAAAFFEDLFSVTERSRIELDEVFQSRADPRRVAARFRYRWTLVDGTEAELECVDIFELSRAPPRWGRGADVEIDRLTIIYDTHEARPSFERVSKEGVKQC